MGMRNLDNPGRAGSEAAEFDGWYMVNIINRFAGDLDVNTKIAFRKALLVSHEVRTLTAGGRINV